MQVLKRERFRVISPARHPLDVLISYLHWALVTRADPEIFAAMPRSRPSSNHATGPKAANFLAMTREWWRRDDTIRLRYEDLAHDAAQTLTPVLASLNLPTRVPLADAVADTSLTKLRRRTGKQASLLARQAGAVEAAADRARGRAHRRSAWRHLRRARLRLRPDPPLTAAGADAAWIELVYASIGKDLEELTATQQQLHDLHVRLDKLAPFERVFRGPLGLARRFQCWLMTHRG